MFLRSTNRKKDGKDHRYFSIVENRRVPGGKTVQRTVLYLGEINDQQQAAWRRTLDVFDEEEQCYAAMSLFPDDREVPADALDSVQIKLSGLELRRPRTYGSCWLACELWHQLGLDEFWQTRLPESREAVSWERCCNCWSSIGCWIRAVSFACIGSGSSPAPWMSCCKPTLRWRKRTGCIAAWTGCWSTSRSCSYG